MRNASPESLLFFCIAFFWLRPQALNGHAGKLIRAPLDLEDFDVPNPSSQPPLTEISVLIDGIAVVTLPGQTVPNLVGSGIWVQEGLNCKAVLRRILMVGPGAGPRS